MSSTVVSLTELEDRQDPWPDPEPLAAPDAPQPYPVDALPPIIRDAVLEAQRFTQAPLPLVANAALAALSVAGQGLADVERAPGLSGPCGLYLLTVAESGERKTTADGLFLDPVRAWERQQREARAPALEEYRSTLAAFEAAQAGYKAKVQQLAKGGRATAEAIATLRDHAALRPTAPRVPLLLRLDATPEALGYSLAHEWPSAGIITGEGGQFLGSHGMGRDSIMRNLGLHNTLWDGRPYRVDRRGTESFTVSGARLTIAIQAQENALREFTRAAPGLARGMGYWARFLVACPESTQGTRLYRDPPAGMPALGRYQSAITALLDALPALTSSGELTPPVLRLAPGASRVWQRFHDDVEQELRPCGELAEVRDVASKGADNAARLACLLHLLEHGPAGEIAAESVESACHLVAWYLRESRRLFASLAVSPDLAQAVALEAWLVARCRATGSDWVSTRDAQRNGPYAIRERAALGSAVAALESAGHARADNLGKQKRIRINPRLLA